MSKQAMTAPVPSDIDGPAGEAGDLIKPVAFSFELANVREADGEYSHYGKPQLSFYAPVALSPGAYRNLTPLVPAAHLAALQQENETLKDAALFDKAIFASECTLRQRAVTRALDAEALALALQQERDEAIAEAAKWDEAFVDRVAKEHGTTIDILSKRLNEYAERIEASEALASSLQRRVEELTGALRDAPRPMCDPVDYMDWFFKPRLAALNPPELGVGK